MPLLAVNDVLDQLSTHQGQIVRVFGSLSLEFESTCLQHIPKAERRDMLEGRYGSSIWVSFDLQMIGMTEGSLAQLDRRHVVLEGVVRAPDPRFGGCGHFSLWPAEIQVVRLARHETDPKHGHQPPSALAEL